MGIFIANLVVALNEAGDAVSPAVRPHRLAHQLIEPVSFELSMPSCRTVLPPPVHAINGAKQPLTAENGTTMFGPLVLVQCKNHGNVFFLFHVKLLVGRRIVIGARTHLQFNKYLCQFTTTIAQQNLETKFDRKEEKITFDTKCQTRCVQRGARRPVAVGGCVDGGAEELGWR